MKLKTAILAGILAGSGLATPGLAAQSGGGLTLRPMLQTVSEDNVILRAFRSVLRRDPTEREFLRYRALVQRNGWTEQDIRRDLSGRTDYYRSSNRGLRPDVAVRSAYQDVLGRDPDPEGLRSYSQKIRREGWTEQDVREALRNSDEYRAQGFRNSSADRIVRRAYQDVLHREPDPEGLENYRRQVLENGWEYHDVRQALARSSERRGNRGGVRDVDATQIVRRAYLSVLNREPDADGLRIYTAKIYHEGWTEDQLVRTLRDSDEYRNRRR
jgi:predicted transcriptional regulator